MSSQTKRKRKYEETAAKATAEVDDDNLQVYDLFTSHSQRTLDEKDVELLAGPKKNRVLSRPSMHGLPNITYFEGLASALEPSLEERLTPKQFGWNSQLCKNYKATLQNDREETDSLLQLAGRYADLHMITQIGNNDYRSVYIAHAVNHLIRTRNIVIGNKRRLDLARSQGEELDDKAIESMRDQGFVRPLMLILCPFKKDAYDIVSRMKQIIFGDGSKDVWSKERFESEFADPETEPISSKHSREFRELMSGNNDDCFRLGMALSKKTLKLYEGFEKSDILLCSPLGLRMILDGEETNETHLVSSIQITVVDRADVILQQNWEHSKLIFTHLHSLPNKITTDISRVKQFFLDGQARNFAQLMLFSRHPQELLTSLVLESSRNYKGLFLQQPTQSGTLDRVELALCQELHRVSSDSTETYTDARFRYFKDRLSSYMQAHTCIVVPSYFDFVRVRNHFKRVEESFVACHEYAPPKKITRARDLFYHGRKNLIVVTERFFYFNRRKIRGIHRLVFYQMPSHPDFYADFINMASLEDGAPRLRSTLMYCSGDRIRMQNSLGTEMTTGVFASENPIQVIATE